MAEAAGGMQRARLRVGDLVRAGQGSARWTGQRPAVPKVRDWKAVPHFFRRRLVSPFMAIGKSPAMSTQQGAAPAQMLR